MNVLVTDGVMKKSLSVVRSIRGVADDIGVTSQYRVSMAGLSRYADQQHIASKDEPLAYVRRLNDIFTAGGYDYLLPVGGWTSNALSMYREDSDAPVDSVLPGKQAMATAQDKWQTYELAKAVDVPVPETIAPTSLDDLHAARELDFPVIVKAPDESAPRFVERAKSMQELRRIVEQYHQQYASWPLIQQLVSGEGCGLFALYLNGTRHGHYGHRRIREYPPSGGASACAVSVQDDQLTDLGTRLLDELDWHGPAMVEFKRDGAGVPHLLEINPKFWGSLDLGRYSGLEFPRALLRYASTGHRPSFSFTSSRCHWPLSGDFQHAIRRPRTAPAVATDLLSPGTQSNISVTDPLPHAFEAVKPVVSLVF